MILSRTRAILIALFIFCALPAGVLSALLTPPGQVPDEPNHLARAAGLLRGAVLIIHHNYINPNTGKLRFGPSVKVQKGLVEAGLGHTTISGDVHKVYLGDLWIMEHTTPDHNILNINIPNTATYFPTAYIPAAIGLRIGLAAGANPYFCFLLARLCMLAAFIGLGTLAISLAAYGEALLFAVLLLPMSLFLAGSLSEDGVLIAIACFAAACLSNDAAAYPGRRLLGIVALVLVLAAKPPYLPLLGLCVLPLFAAGVARRILAAALASVPVLVWLALVLHFTAVPFGKPAYHPGPYFAGDPATIFTSTDAAANLHILLAAPSRLLILPWVTAKFLYAEELHEMIGALGLMQIRFVEPVYDAWGVAILVPIFALLISRRQSALVTATTTATVILLLTATCWSILISLYLNWTPVGEGYIDGFQGRYMIPLLPFFLLIFSNARPRTNLPGIIPALPAIALGIADTVLIPIKLVTFFYLH